MASQGKFSSVNLNKSSYGRPLSSTPSTSLSHGSRPRSGGGSGGAGATPGRPTGSGGMVVLSRPRRLAVPPPLNLPSLRKEHERFDVSSASGRPAGGGSSSHGPGHGSQTMGWSRNSAIQAPSRLPEDAPQVGKSAQQRPLFPPKNRDAVAQERNLIGEDFPSLLATFEVSKKQKDAVNQKIKLKVEEPVVAQAPSGAQIRKDNFEKTDDSLSDLLSLPAVNLKHKSDWADDERDTGLRSNAFSSNSRDFLRTDSYGRDSAAETVLPKSTMQRNGYQESWHNRRMVASPLAGRYADMNSPKGHFSPGPSARDRRIIPEVIKPGVDDSVGGLSGDVAMKFIKRKKEASKPSDFYDPVRESFEVELQRVQQLQEMERRRVLEEQTRAMEMARREEEERERLAREEEEARRKFEAEAREAAQREEQERLDASRKAEEQRIAREEEKKRILMEEERRKEAAREKLLELEARIARRQAESAAKTIEQRPLPGDGQPNRVLSQTNSEFGSVNRNIDAVSRIQPSRDSDHSVFAEKGRSNDSWRKSSGSNASTTSIQTLEKSFKSHKQDTFGPVRGFERREYSASSTSAPASTSLRGVRMAENDKLLDDFHHSGSETEGLEGNGQMDWRHSRSSDEHFHSAYSSLQDAETDGVSAFGRSRYSFRQPRVPPPPFSLTQRRSFRATSDPDHQGGKYEGQNVEIRYENGYQNKMSEALAVAEFEKLTISSPNEEKTSPRCASQSSLSVTSPPSSPTQLSHEDLEGSKESLAFSDAGHPPSAVESGEDDDWDIENGGVQNQEEYEGDNSDREEDEAHDEDDENIAYADENVDHLPIGLEDKLCDNNEEEAPQSSQKDLVNQEGVRENVLNDPTSQPLVSTSSMTTVSSLPSQPNEVPVKLQFGLFSGPSLIPPPVPAIQIGSIQMPLPLPQVHSSQSPFFQFGQLGYPSLPQGLLPFVHSTLPPAHYSVTHGNITVSQTSPSVSGSANIQQSLATSAFDVSEGNMSDMSKKEECPPENKVGFRQEDLNVQQPHTNKGDSTGQKSDQVVSLSNTDGKVSRRFMNYTGGRGKRYVYKVKSSSSSKPLLPEPEDLAQTHSFPRRFSHNGRRGDYRPKEPVSLAEKQHFSLRTRAMGPFRSGTKRDHFLSKSNVPVPISESKTVKAPIKEHILQRNKRYESIEEDIDPPVQSGIIRIYKQPGIEVPSDEDDFIEVRSKRQMLNDRRELREKQNKAKSRVLKMPRRPRSPNPSYSNKNGFSVQSMERDTGIIPSAISSSSPFDMSTPKVVATQHLAPIGTPSISADGDDRSSRTTMIAPGGTKLSSGLGFEKDIAADRGPLALRSWNEPLREQQVNILPLSDTGIKDGLASSIETEKLPESSIKTHEKTYSSSATSLSSVFPGERIQFGAVTAAKIFHPLSRAVSRMPSSEESSSIFLEKEKLREESTPLNDTEAEAEAAASAVAVAAISNDEVIGNELADNGISSGQGFQGSQNGSSRQPAGEEALTVALPADLSVETPISLWPPLRSSQSNAGPMISCFPGGPPSQYPCYEMNPMMGGPIFTFGGGPDESSGAPAQQLQRAGPTHLGPWPHSGADSFYGPPAGFTGPFISPPLGIPGVQPQPHMLVYNHFTPVGQFGQLGQLGLGFMGATYIPSAKQPDWKHSSGSANGGINGNVNVNVNVNGGAPAGVSGQQRGASSLLPVASPLTMFDMSPFQPQGEFPVQARWSHISTVAPLSHSVPLAVQSSSHYQADKSSAVSGDSFLPEAQSTGSADQGLKFSKPLHQFPEERDLMGATQTVTNSTSAAYSSPVRSSVIKGHGIGNGPTVARVSADDLSTAASGSSSALAPSQVATVSSTVKIHAFKPSPAVAVPAAHQLYSQANGGSGDWYRRQGLRQGKNLASVSDKGYSSVKVKQIYVAKPASSGASSSA